MRTSKGRVVGLVGREDVRWIRETFRKPCMVKKTKVDADISSKNDAYQ